MFFLHIGQKRHCLAMLIVALVKTVHCWWFDKENNLLNTRSSSIIIEDSKVNKKNQMKVSGAGNVESLCTTICRRVWRYMSMYIKLSATDNAKQCCRQRKPKEFHNCWTSNSTEDNNTDFWIFMFSCNMKFIQAQRVHIVLYIKQKLIVLQSNLGAETFKFDSNTETMMWGTACMRNCNEFCNNQTYLTATN